MLAMYQNCQCCDRTLAPDHGDAAICSFECTFCLECAAERLSWTCPNCSGDLVRRPARAPNYLARFPPSRDRKPTTPDCGRATPGYGQTSAGTTPA